MGGGGSKEGETLQTVERAGLLLLAREVSQDTSLLEKMKCGAKLRA